MAGALALKLSGCMQPPEPVRTATTPVIVKQPADKQTAPAPRLLKGPITMTWKSSCPTISYTGSRYGVPLQQNAPALQQAEPLAMDSTVQAKDVKYDVNSLAELLAKDTNPKVRGWAAERLWEMAGEAGRKDEKTLIKIVEWLLSALDDKNESVRKKADESLSEYSVRHLINFGDIKNAHTLLANEMIKALSSPSSRVRRVAARMLGELFDRNALSGMAELGMDKEAGMLRDLAARNVLPRLKKIKVSDPDKRVRAAAAEAITSILYWHLPEVPGTGGPAER